MAFPFCKTQVPTKTPRIIPLSSGKWDLHGSLLEQRYSWQHPNADHEWNVSPVSASGTHAQSSPSATQLSQRGAPLQRSQQGAYLRGLTAPDGPAHPQPARGIARPVAAGLLPGWWKRVSARRERAGKGDPGIVGIATAFAYYPVLWNFEVVLAMKTGSFGAWFSSFNRS